MFQKVKKSLLLFLALSIVALPIFAATQVQRVSSSQSVAKGATGYSNSINTTYSDGYIAVRLVSTAGSVNVSQQCSIDNSTWYDPVDEDGVLLGVVASAQTVTTGKYIQYIPVLSKYIRYKIAEQDSSDTTVTMDAIVSEER